MKLSTSISRRNSLQLSSNDSPLTPDQLRTIPALHSTTPHHTRSPKFQAVSTMSVIDALRTEGFEPFFVAQTVSKSPDRIPHAKHLVRLRHRSSSTKGGANEVVLLNANDGTASYQMLAGWIEALCLNRCVAGTEYEDLRIPHLHPNIHERVIEGAYRVLDTFERVNESRERMIATPIQYPRALTFANNAADRRWPDPAKLPCIHPSDLLEGPHAIDNLWGVFQNVQRNLLNGGFKALASTTTLHTKEPKRIRVRPITAVGEHTRLNRLLWSEVEHLARELS